MHNRIILLGLLSLWLATEAVAATVTVEWTRQPGTQTDTEIVVWSADATGPDHPKAMKVTVPAATDSLALDGAAFARTFPGVDYFCYSGRKAGDPWWVDSSGTPPCKGNDVVMALIGTVVPPVVPPPVVPPPVVPPPVTPPPGLTKAEVQAMIDATLKSILAARDAHVLAAIDACLKKKNPTAIACVRAIRDAWKEIP